MIMIWNDIDKIAPDLLPNSDTGNTTSKLLLLCTCSGIVHLGYAELIYNGERYWNYYTRDTHCDVDFVRYWAEIDLPI